MNPKTKRLFFLFVIVSIAEIVMISTGNETLRLLTKPLIIASLFAPDRAFPPPRPTSFDPRSPACDQS